MVKWQMTDVMTDACTSESVQRLMSTEAWRVSVSCWSGYAQFPVSDWLRHTASPSSEQHSVWLHLSLTPALSSSPSPLLSLLCRCWSHTLSTCFLQPFFLFRPPSLSLSPTYSPFIFILPHLLSLCFSLFHSFSVYTEECSMWQAVALWLLILATLLRGEWLSSVLWVMLEQVCVFCMCCTQCACLLLISVHSAALFNTGRESVGVQPDREMDLFL